MEDFAELLARCRSAAEGFVRFRLPIKADADDLLQEVYLAAWKNFSQLKSAEAFKPWLLAIARRKCSDYFREKAAQLDLPLTVLESLPEKVLADGRLGEAEVKKDQAEAVRETLALLDKKDRQILRLYFWEDLPQTEIAARLQIPVGTVKSRLYAAKQRFKAQYPCPEQRKGEIRMKKLPKLLPDYQIEALNEPVFPVEWEELDGWFLIPRLGEKLSWGIYDLPSRKCSHIYDMEVTGKARIHGIEGVELTARESALSGKKEIVERTFIAQLTDTRCRYLAAFRNDGDVRSYLTFLDGDEFMASWGFGEDNCGTETHLAAKGLIRREGDTLTVAPGHPYLQDLVGRYRVTIGGRTFDTVCRIEINSEADGTLDGVLAEQFIDASGKTVLWRRYNRSDWAIEHYKIPWEQQLPDNQRLIVNGNVYVHWYDCVTDYVF